MEQISLFTRLKNLYSRTKNNITGSNGWNISFWWEMVFAEDPRKKWIEKIVDIKEEVFKIFSENENISEEEFIKKLSSLK